MTQQPARRTSAATAFDDIQANLRAALDGETVELLPMPQVASRIVALAFDASSRAAELAIWIERDPTLAGQVMRVANSALFRPRYPVISLQQAITWLGLGEVQHLALALAVRGQVFKAPGHEAEVEELWRESLACAVWARKLATVRRRDADAAYLSGLLHAVGRAAVVRVISRFESRQRLVIDTRSFALLADEFEAEFAQKVVSDWQLPEVVAGAIMHWRSYSKAGQHCEEAALVQAARQLATVSLHPELLQSEYLSANPVFEFLRLTERELQGLLKETALVREFVASL